MWAVVLVLAAVVPRAAADLGSVSGGYVGLFVGLMAVAFVLGFVAAYVWLRRRRTLTHGIADKNPESGVVTRLRPDPGCYLLRRRTRSTRTRRRKRKNN